MPPVTLAQHLAHAAERWPGGLAVRTANAAWTFSDLLAQVRQAAGSLATEAAPILALAGDNWQLALAAYACSTACKALWPLDPAAPASRWPAWQALGGDAVHRLAAAPPAGPAVAIANPAADAPALVIATSGSEGDPKAVMLSHANLTAAATASRQRLPLGPGDLWLDCLPLFHIGGMSILWRCAQAGAGVLLHDGFAADAVADSLGRQPVTHISLVPAMLARLLDLGMRPPPSLRAVLVGGAALSRPLFERAVAGGWPVLPSWGMSETAAQIATFSPADGLWREGAVGRPLPGNEVALAADGRLRVRGPQVMLGYLNGQLQPGHGLAGGWLISSDLGSIDGDGRVTILGRADDMLVTGGSKVHPAEVEHGLAACPGIADVAVAGLPDPVWGHIVVAVVVGEADDAAIDHWSRAHLRPPARPRRILRLPQLPRNATGKVDRAALRHLVAEVAA